MDAEAIAVNLSYRTHRMLPTVAAVVLFLLLGSVLVGRLQPGPRAAAPEDEVRAVYFALNFPRALPETLDTETLRRLLGSLDAKFAPVADRITVDSYTADPSGFVLQLRHSGLPGRTFTLTNRGIR
jgi:hypothetical protein